MYVSGLDLGPSFSATTPSLKGLGQGVPLTWVCPHLPQYVAFFSFSATTTAVGAWSSSECKYPAAASR